MAVNIFEVPVKTTINRTLQAKSIMLCGKSKSGKSTVASQAPRPIFLMTENGTEAITGITPIPIATWGDFKSAVSQLCTAKAREQFDSVVIDTYTNLILLLDKYIGQKLSTNKASYDFGSEIDYGKGTKAMRNELGVQLQKLANQGYILINIVHAEDKVDFDTNKSYIGTSLSNSLYGVAEKFVDQIVYLRKDINKDGSVEHRIWFNGKGGFAGAGGRFTPDVDSVPCSYDELEKALLGAMDKLGETSSKPVTFVEEDKPSVIIEEDKYDFEALLKEFNTLTKEIVDDDAAHNPLKIKAIVEAELGTGRKASDLSPNQAELLAIIVTNLKAEFNK